MSSNHEGNPEVFRDKVVPVAWLFLASVIIGMAVGFFARPDVHAGSQVVSVPTTLVTQYRTLTVPQLADVGAIGGNVR